MTFGPFFNAIALPPRGPDQDLSFVLKGFFSYFTDASRDLRASCATGRPAWPPAGGHHPALSIPPPGAIPPPGTPGPGGTTTTFSQVGRQNREVVGVGCTS